MATLFLTWGNGVGLTGLKAISKFWHSNKGKWLRDIPRVNSKASIMSGNIKPSDPRTGTAAQGSYQPRDRVELRPDAPFNPYAGLGQALYPHTFSGSAAWNKRQGRWREYGILIALWLLVLLVAGVIAIRVLDLSAGAPRQDDYDRASVAPHNRADATALRASRLDADDDPFDDPLPALPPVKAATPASITAPTASAATTLRASADIAATGAQQPLAVAGALSLVPDAPPLRPAAPVGMSPSASARMPAACAPALSAMQLCEEAGK